MPIKKYLLAPGPTPVPPEALMAMAMPVVHHRSPEFIPILEAAENGLRRLFRTKNDVLILCCTGTGGMTGSVINFFSPGDSVLVVNAGNFGERWTRICRAYGLSVIEITVEWGYAANPDDLEEILKKNPDVKGVFVQACETSTGVYHDIRSIAGTVRASSDAILVVDAISALVAHDIRMDDWGLDVLIGGSQKGLMLPPGLAFVAASEKAWAAAEKSKLPKFYFDFRAERKKLREMQTNFTTPSTLIVGLNECIKLIETEGLDNALRRHEKLARAMRKAVSAMGLELFSKESPSNSVTAIVSPPGISGQDIFRNLRLKYGITAAGGQGRAKGKIFRIAHLGHADVFDVITAAAGIEMTLRGMGCPLELGRGVAAAEEMLMAQEE